MQNTDEQRQELLNRLNIGLSYQLILLFVEQAFVLEREDSVTALSDLFEKFVESLSQEEKKQFGQKMKELLDKRAEEIQTKLAEELSPTDLASVKQELQDLAASAKS